MRYSTIVLALGLLPLVAGAATAGKIAPAPNGIEMPQGYKD